MFDSVLVQRALLVAAVAVGAGGLLLYRGLDGADAEPGVRVGATLSALGAAMAFASVATSPGSGVFLPAFGVLVACLVATVWIGGSWLRERVSDRASDGIRG